MAAIADTSAKSFKSLVGAKPIIAMLSHSTKGSAKHPLVDKVVEATRIAHERYPHLLLDGELQTDAAIIPSVAKHNVDAIISITITRHKILPVLFMIFMTFFPPTSSFLIP